MGHTGHTGPGDTETGAGVINILDVCVSAGGDSAGVDIRSIIQSVTWELNSGLKQPYFCRELWKQNICVFRFSFIPVNTSVTKSPLSLQLLAAECTPLAGMRVCQVCRGIRGHSSSVKLCRRMLLSAMLGISSPARRQRDAGLWENWSGVKCCQHWPLWDPSPSPPPPPSTLWEPRPSLHNGAKKEAAVWKSTLPQLQFRLQQPS